MLTKKHSRSGNIVAEQTNATKVKPIMKKMISPPNGLNKATSSNRKVKNNSSTEEHISGFRNVWRSRYGPIKTFFPHSRRV